jgi:hypothetical protein
MDMSVDVRQGIRSLRRHGGLTLAAMTTLGLGIGAALTMAGSWSTSCSGRCRCETRSASSCPGASSRRRASGMFP